jgi:hypothetical protein
MRLTDTVSGVLALLALVGAPGVVMAQAPAELPPARDADGNIVETYAVVGGEMVEPPSIPMGEPSVIASIFHEGVHNSQVMDLLTHLAEEIGPRLTGSTALERANEWSRDLFASWGLENAHLDQWGEIAYRFDRGPSWGKAHLGNEEREIEGLTTLAWVPGTDGPTRAPAVRLPRTIEEYEAVADRLPGAWVVIPTDYSGRRGIRGVTGAVRARYEARAEIRANGAPEPPSPSAAWESDPFAGPWQGAISGGVLGDMRYPMTLTLERSRRRVAGSMAVGDSAPAPIENATLEDGVLTFEWESPRGRSRFQVSAGGEGLSGSGHRVEDESVFYDIAFSRPDVSDLDPAGPTEEQVLELVLGAGPVGFVSSSKDERVWTTSVNGWRELTPETLAEDLEVIVSGPDYDWINSRLADGAEVELEFDMQNTLIRGPFPVYNTVAEIRGTEFPDEVVIASAHLDSWNGPGSQGVTDNGTGSAVMMEAARILQAVGARPKRTIRFMLWTGEEQGLLGSRAYVESLSEEERAKIVCCFVDDGGTNTQGGVQGIEAMRDYLAAATAPINGRIWDETDGRYLNVNVQVIDSMPRGGGSDHASFNRVGIPGFYWQEIGRAVYGYGWHTQFDRLDLAIPNYLRQSATTTAITAYNLACAPEMLPRGESEEEEGDGG